MSEHGEIAGSVSGGCVEGAVIEAAEAVLAGAPPHLLSYGVDDAAAWDIGLPCGGELDVWVQGCQAGADPPRFEQLAQRGARAAEVTLLAGPSAGSKLLVEAGGDRSGSLGDPDLDREAIVIGNKLLWEGTSQRHQDLFVDVIGPAPRLVMFGAGEVSVELCVIARRAGWRPYVVDPRARFATDERFPEAEAVIRAWPEEAIAQLGGLDRATSVVVLTHDPKLDDPAVILSLRSQARFIGAMGSRRAQAARLARLAEAGLSESELSRLSAPVGLDIGAMTAGETALSIMAELVAARYGRQGSPLAYGSGRIHNPSLARTEQTG